jgi:hypothetical protein
LLDRHLSASTAESQYPEDQVRLANSMANSSALDALGIEIQALNQVPQFFRLSTGGVNPVRLE